VQPFAQEADGRDELPLIRGRLDDLPMTEGEPLWHVSLGPALLVQSYVQPQTIAAGGSRERLVVWFVKYVRKWTDPELDHWAKHRAGLFAGAARLTQFRPSRNWKENHQGMVQSGLSELVRTVLGAQKTLSLR
jgi:hypothetical protein